MIKFDEKHENCLITRVFPSRTLGPRPTTINLYSLALKSDLFTCAVLAKSSESVSSIVLPLKCSSASRPYKVSPGFIKKGSWVTRKKN